MLVCYLYILTKISTQVLSSILISLFIFLLLNYECCLSDPDLDPRTLSTVSFANTFSYSLGCLSTFLIMSYFTKTEF